MVIKKIKKFLAITVTIGLVLLGLPKLVSELYAKNRIYTLQTAPSAKVAIVFGAGLTRDGRPTPVLRDRVTTAANLYFSGKVQKILMSGDNRFVEYNEPGAMFNYAVELGVPEQDIVLDYAGRRSYDTCYRARHIFGVKDALLITQEFHLPRSLFLCNALGIQADGVTADLRTYSRRAHQIWKLREIPATLMAFVDVYLTRPVPVLGNPEPIFPVESKSPPQPTTISSNIKE